MKDIETGTTYPDEDGPKDTAAWLLANLERQLAEISQAFRERTVRRLDGEEKGTDA